MKKLALVLLLVAGFGFPSAEAGIVATGDVVKVYSGIGALNGGAFRVDVLGKGSTTDFWTFCIERDEYFTPGASYYVKLALAAEGGGIQPPPPATNDPLDTKTAWLYRQYAMGTLAGFTNNAFENTSLQLAIWRIEQEVNWAAGVYTEPGNNAVIGQAYSVRADYYYNLAFANANGSLYGVQVMQMWTGYNNGVFSGNSQDMLVKVPDGGMTLILLGGALVGIGALRRKFRL